MTNAIERDNLRRRWVNVTADRPCPACRKPDWCRVRDDGRIVACYRQPAGAYRSKADRNGTPCHLHRIDGSPAAPFPSVTPPTPGAARADADTLHAVNQALLNTLRLSDAHLDGLRRRGLADDAIERNG